MFPAMVHGDRLLFRSAGARKNLLEVASPINISPPMGRSVTTICCTSKLNPRLARAWEQRNKVQSSKYKVLSSKYQVQTSKVLRPKSKVQSPFYPSKKCSVVSPKRSLSPLSKTRGWRGASLMESLITVPLTEPRSSTRNVSPSRQILA